MVKIFVKDLNQISKLFLLILLAESHFCGTHATVLPVFVRIYVLLPFFDCRFGCEYGTSKRSPHKHKTEIQNDSAEKRVSIPNRTRIEFWRHVE
jgi:hypothetical protein